MAIPDKQRAKLHAMLDELINEDDSMPDGGAFLMIREVLVTLDQNKVERSLLLRGFLGRKSMRLRELVRQIRASGDAPSYG